MMTRIESLWSMAKIVNTPASFDAWVRPLILPGVGAFNG
jgi:hypothetical protein